MLKIVTLIRKPQTGTFEKFAKNNRVAVHDFQDFHGEWLGMMIEYRGSKKRSVWSSKKVLKIETLFRKPQTGTFETRAKKKLETVNVFENFCGEWLGTMISNWMSKKQSV